METSLQRDHPRARKPTDDQPAVVALDGRDGPVGDLVVRDRVLGFDLLCQPAEPGAQDEADAGAGRHEWPQRRRRAGYLAAVYVRFGHSSG
jgi:hypothetical protein